MLRALAATVTAFCILAPSALAHHIPHRKPIKLLPLKAQKVWYERNVQHAKATLRWWRTTGDWATDAKRFAQASSIARRDIAFHTRLLRNAQRNLRRIRADFEPVGICWACWDRVALCESTGNWSINNGNGFFGGLQFTYGTWLNSGGGRYAQRADLATRVQQITIANPLSLSNWPVCGSRY